MFRSILHRTIFWELVKVFMLALIGITGMLLMAGIVAACVSPATGQDQGPLGFKMLKKLKCYAGPAHPHEAQQPKPLDVTKA